MSPKSNNKRGDRRARQNKNSDRGVTIMTPSTSFERRLATTSDASVLRGKFFVTQAIGTGVNGIFSITPASLGARAAALASIYSSYRIKYIGLKFSSNSATTPFGSSTSVLGVVDDANTTEGDFPVNISDILELRCSGSFLAPSTVPTEFMFKPVDNNLWYKTYVGQSGSDPRLTSPGYLVASSPNASTTLVIEIDYEIVFKGAVDIGST